VRNYNIKLPHADGVKVKTTRHGLRISVRKFGYKIFTGKKSTYGKSKSLGLHLKSFRFRHLKLGLPYLFKVLLTDLKFAVQRNKINSLPPTYESSWLNRTLTFTIALTVYNQSYFELERAIQSILKQKRRPDVIEVLDDGSSNLRTQRALKKLRKENPSIKFLKSKNKGVVQARNYLISRCKTSHLLFLDPDDELLPEYLEAAEALFISNRMIEVVYPDVVIRNPEKQVLWSTGPFDASTLMLINTIPMSSVCSTNMLRELDGYSLEFENGYEDWDLWTRAALSGVQGAHLGIPGYYYSEKLVSRSSAANLHKVELVEKIQGRVLGKLRDFPPNSIGNVNVFIIAPWFIQGGGVDVLLDRLLRHFSNRKVALVTTEIVPREYKSAITTELKQKIPIVEKQFFMSEEGFLRNLQALASQNAVIINLSSPWAFDNASELKIFAKHHFAFAFNEIGARRVIECDGPLTEAWPVYDYLKSELGKLKSKKIPVELIYVGIEKEKRTKKTQANPRKLRVGWLGRLSPEKDPQMFIATSKFVNPNEFSFSMAGGGPLREKVISELKHNIDFKYLGFVESSKRYLEDLDILALTSKIEGIPLVAMEALQNGVYVIAPRIGGIPDLITDKQNGLLYNGTKKDLLRALIEARSIILSGESRPKLSKMFLEETMFNHIESRIKHYRQLPQTKPS
jgi:glycosyltransferase involved in cell wall biosynthesis